MRHWAIGAVVLLCAASAVAQQSSTTGQLVIVSTPPGAEISVDGKVIGKAPITARDLMPGDHFIEARWEGGRSTNSMQHVNAGASLAVQMLLPIGSIVVMSDPAGAEIFIDNNPFGRAPTTVNDINTGDHRVTARWPNGATLTNFARVMAGNATQVLLRMPPPGYPQQPMPPPPPPQPMPPPPQQTYAPPPPQNPVVVVPAPENQEQPSPAPIAAPPPPPPQAPPPAPPPVAATATTSAPPPAAETPVYKKWWLWTLVGVAVVGIAVGVGVGVGTSGGNSRYGIAEF